MHELCHGLGFTSLLVPVPSSTNPTGLINFNTVISTLSAFDVRNLCACLCVRPHTLSDTQINLYRTSPSLVPLSTWQDTRRAANREALLNAATSNSLVFRTVSGGDVALYAPGAYQSGSSIAHLRLGVYPREQSLMLPFLNDGEVLHNPGAPTFRILETVGHVLKPAAIAIVTGSAAATTTTTTAGGGSTGGATSSSTAATTSSPTVATSVAPATSVTSSGAIAATSAAAPVPPVVTSAQGPPGDIAASAALIPCVMLLLCAWCILTM